ncbi:MAG: TolB family protein [Anaerolineales bacterium]
MSTSPLNARRRLAFAISALVIAILVFSSCVGLSGELLRPIPPARTPAPTSIPTQLGGGDGLIAFESRRDGNSEIYVMNADGSGQRNLTNSPAEDVNPVWSPDGTWLAFSRIVRAEQCRYIFSVSRVSHPAPYGQ